MARYNFPIGVAKKSNLELRIVFDIHAPNPSLAEIGNGRIIGQLGRFQLVSSTKLSSSYCLYLLLVWKRAVLFPSVLYELENNYTILLDRPSCRIKDCLKSETEIVVLDLLLITETQRD